MPLSPEAQKAYDRKRQRQRRAKGLCINCGKALVVKPRIACETCRTKQRQAKRRLARQREHAGLCSRCGERPPKPGGKLCQKCNVRWMQGYRRHSGYKPARARRRQKLKRTVIEHYGGVQCVCCGVAEIAFLTIDHIRGKGRAHRRSLNRRGDTFYRWLKVHHYPAGYRVLCMNCNASLGYYGYCPHQKERL